MGLKEAICQKCGDKGYTETLICCSKCKDSFEHRYCLDDAADIFKEDVTWTCVECVSKRCRKQPKFRRIMGLPRRSSNRLSQVVKAKMASKQKEVPEAANVGLKKADINEGEDLSSDCAENEKRGAPFVGEFEGRVSKPEKESDFPTGVGIGFSCMRNDSQTIGGESFGFSYVYALPLLDPIWRGSFRTCYKQFSLVESLEAHLSTKACLKVRNEARLFPRIILSDMLTRLSVWPKSFQQSRPTDISIALYFFPERRDDELFYSLVDTMIADDLALRSDVENAELLVFTSVELPVEYWKFEGKHYLWGVFRAKRNSVAKSTLVSRVEG